MWPFTTKVVARQAVKYSSVMLSLGQARWLSHSYRALAKEGYQQNPVVYACVTKLARDVSSVDLHLYKFTRKGELQKIKSHPILDLMARPNPSWSSRQFVEKLATQYLIGGNAYVLGNNKTRPPSELWLLPPESVTVRPGNLLPEAYVYRPGTETVYPVNQVTGLSQVLHLRTVNPLDEWNGLPPMAAAAYGVDVFNAGQEWNKSLLQNEARPSGALQMRQGKDGFTQQLSEEQYARLKLEVDSQYTGSGNAGRPLLIDGALEWVQMGLNARDMDHKENMLASARLIAGCYGTPPMLVGIPGESTFANYGEAKLAYWADTVLPFLGMILDDFNRWLPRLYGEKCFLWFDEEQVPALEPLREMKSRRLNASEYLTINEKREAMGHAKHANPMADDILVTRADIPLAKAGEDEPTQQEKTD